jgi:hypothetical protein
MLEEFWRHQESAAPTERASAWSVLHTLLSQEQIDPPLRELMRMVQRLRDETDSAARLRAIETLLASALLRTRGRRIRPTGLAKWFWQPFRQPAAVFRAIEAERHRDEDAAIELARVLTRRDFPKTEFIRLPLADPRWQERLDLPRTCCFVGRLEIFGDQAIDAFRSSGTRFFFPDRDRPPDLAPGALDPRRFHRIHQRRNGRVLDPPFPSREERGRRTDYALVQRYFQADRKRHVFVFAGNSTLGTLGAVFWAAGLQDQHIPLPDKDFDANESFEVLLEVAAPVVEHPWQWQPDQIRPVRMLAGKAHEWFESLQAWGRPSTDLILIKHNNQGEAVEIYADEPAGPAVFRNRGTQVRFIESLFHKSGGKAGQSVPANRFANEQAWKDLCAKPVLRKRLREHLPGAITISSDPPLVTLNVPIVEFG